MPSDRAVLGSILVILSMVRHSSAIWCICKSGLSDAVLQKTLDYACGAGADCNPIHQNSACFLPNTVKDHCSFAVNSYFQRKGQAVGSCDFSGTAITTTSDPSVTGCVYPSSASNPGTTPVTTPTTTTPSMGTPSTTTTNTPTTTSPYTTTPTGVLGGGVGNGVGPSGAGINTDYSQGGMKLQENTLLTSFITFLLSSIMIWWG